MKKTKITDFILNKMKFTGIFLHEIIYFNRIRYVLNMLKSNINNIEQICNENSDVIKNYTKIKLNNKDLYKIAV